MAISWIGVGGCSNGVGRGPHSLTAGPHGGAYRNPRRREPSRAASRAWRGRRRVNLGWELLQGEGVDIQECEQDGELLLLVVLLPLRDLLLAHSGPVCDGNKANVAMIRLDAAFFQCQGSAKKTKQKVIKVLREFRHKTFIA